MNDYPFLTEAQVEEMETFGMVEVTDQLLEALFDWCNQTQSDS